MKVSFVFAALALAIFANPLSRLLAEEAKEKLYPDPINVHPKPIHEDRSVKYDYDIVYIRAPRGRSRS